MLTLLSKYKPKVWSKYSNIWHLLVIKVYLQWDVIEYTKTYALEGRLETTCIVLSFVVYCNI